MKYTVYLTPPEINSSGYPYPDTFTTLDTAKQFVEEKRAEFRREWAGFQSRLQQKEIQTEPFFALEWRFESGVWHGYHSDGRTIFRIEGEYPPSIFPKRSVIEGQR